MSSAHSPDPLRGMSPELRTQFDALPNAIRRAYVDFRIGRGERKGAHRDQLEAFIAGYHARGSAVPLKKTA